MTSAPAYASMKDMSTATSYVRHLDAALVGPRRVKRGLLREAGDHLEDATEAYRAAGYDADSAQSMAVTDFGAVEEVAPSFQTTLAVASSRRTAWLLFGALAIQPFIWDGPIGPKTQDPDSAAHAILNVLVEVGGGLLIATSLVLLAATGIGNRWFAAGRRVARFTSITALAGAVYIKLSAVGMLLLSGAASEPILWLLFAAFILVPMSMAGASARRTLATC
jgi:hypothetical protein